MVTYNLRTPIRQPEVPETHVTQLNTSCTADRYTGALVKPYIVNKEGGNIGGHTCIYNRPLVVRRSSHVNYDSSAQFPTDHSFTILPARR